jgi:hypothetical protein
MAKRRFTIVLIKPSHYDDDGYVIQWRPGREPPLAVTWLRLRWNVGPNGAVGAHPQSDGAAQCWWAAVPPQGHAGPRMPAQGRPHLNGTGPDPYGM